MRPSNLFPVLVVLAAPTVRAGDDDLISSSRAVVESFKKKDANVEKFLSSAAGYAVFPSIIKGGFIVGGAGGDGILFVGGQPVGKTSVGQASIGFQLGGESFSEIVFFENASTLNDFKKGNFALAAQASAVALSAGAAASANYQNGVAIFVATKTGLMYEASVGGQKFGFKPFDAKKK
jgi:lipid-binding SYLF domain-containing protein